MSALPAPVTGTAAGVPFLAVPPPSGARRDAPVVVAWHLMDPPCTEGAFAAALPLRGLDAWRIYLGLPMCGSRLPAGGFEEVMRLGYEDAVLNLQGPITARGATEFPAAFAELRRRLDLGDGPLALVGGSIGAAVALLVAVETAPSAGIELRAAVLVSPVTRLRPAVDATARRYDMVYPWGDESSRVARRLDFVDRADEIVAAGQPAVRIIAGADDDADGFLNPARELTAALAERYDDPSRVDVVVVEGMGHELAEEPGIEPAPQTTHAAIVDQHSVAWLETHLVHAAVRDRSGSVGA